MFLVDTNVWLESLLDQENAVEVREFLQRVPTDDLAMTDFAFHSIGVILGRFGEMDALVTFTDEAFVDGAVTLVHVRPDEMLRVAEAMRKYELDFDDAYQVVAAELHDLELVSFDSDLDRAPAGRSRPAETSR